MIALREALDEDRAILTEMLYYALYVPEGEEPFPKSILDEPRIRAYVDGWRRNGDDGVLAIDSTDDRPVGAIWVRLFDHWNPGYGFVDEETPELSMAIVPGRRGQGIGTALLRLQLNRLDINRLSVSLSVSEENPARRLYLRHGFEVVDSSAGTVTMLRPAKSRLCTSTESDGRTSVTS